MPFKINISEKTSKKTWKIESDSETLLGRKLGEKFDGKEISADLAGYELEITGGSDIAGFPHKKEVEGPELKRVLLTKGWGMHKKPKWEGKKKVSTPKGLRLKKTVRGNQIGEKTVQINLVVMKEGSKKLSEVFPDQNKPKEQPKEPSETSTPQPQEQTDNAQEAKEEQKEKVKEEITEEVKEEIKEDIPESPETKTEEQKEEAAEKVAEEVAEEVQEAVEKAAGEKKE